MSGATMAEANDKLQQVIIRRAGPADAQAVYDLVVALAEARDAMDKVVSTGADIARDGFGANPAFEALIAELDGAPVGLCLYFGSYSTWRGQRGIYVQDFIVADRARNLGVGRRLLAAMAELAKACGCGYLRLSVEADNASAQAFYRRCGFAHSEAELIYVLNDTGFDDLACGAEEGGA
ncbi:MAG: GNAT family N-acetyltransferase [Kiloniellaceae bacterium]